MESSNTFGMCLKLKNNLCFNSIWIIMFKRCWSQVPFDIFSTLNTHVYESEEIINNSDEWIVVKDNS
jgi:hypothetical protein